MKKWILFAALLTLAVGVAACTDEETPSKITVNGGEKNLSLDALARSGELTIVSTGPWRLTKAAASEWLTLTPDSGEAGITTVTLSLGANRGAARSAVLSFATGDAISSFRVSQNGSHVAFGETDYNFYVTFGTMPTLYAGLYLLSSDAPAWVFYSRSQTFDPAEFPAQATVLRAADPTANATDADIDRVATDLRRRIREIDNADPTATFGLYVDDIRCRIGYDWFVAQGIDPSRVRVTLLSDGTATYQNFYDYFGDPSTALENWERYAAEVEALDWNHGGRFPETRAAYYNPNSPTWVYHFSSRPGYRLIMQDESLLEPREGFLAEKIDAMEVESVQPSEMLAALPAAEKQRFYRMAGFDYDRFAALFDQSAKKNLVVIGTSHTSSASEQSQRDYVTRIVERYGAEYDIFFKPHPADTSSRSYETDFEGLTLLPGQMPFEIFVWSLIDRVDMIGGYPSTVYLTVPVEKVRFLFARDAASLVRPLDILFRDATQVEWM